VEKGLNMSLSGNSRDVNKNECIRILIPAWFLMGEKSGRG
jgi:hypothetical protein